MSSSLSWNRRGQRANVSRSSSSSSTDLRGEICRCELRSSVRVCSTAENAGRRFVGCHYFPNRCNHFVWIDPPLTRRGVEYAAQMQAENRALQYQIRLLEEEFEAYRNAAERRAKISIDSAVAGGEYQRMFWVLTGAILMLVVLLFVIVLGH